MKTLSMKGLAALGLGAAMTMGAANVALAAPSNLPPPAGAILDLDGQVIPHNSAAPQHYTVDFSAAVANTAITFAFREDPAFEFFSNASVVDLTNPSGNLLTNGNFLAGTVGSSNATGWTYANIYGATFGGTLRAPSFCGAGFGGSGCWYDGAVQAYDAISQTVGTNVGDTYQISFDLWDNSGLRTWSRLSTNGNVTNTGGNGADVLVYAQDGLPPPGAPAPVPGVGFAGLAALLALAGAAKVRSLRG